MAPLPPLLWIDRCKLGTSVLPGRPHRAVTDAKTTASLVWTFKGEVADDVKSWHDDYFIDACQRAFGYRAGAITATSERVFYPLQLRRAHRSIHHRCVILGNASHALHPIAGQGFNLGLRDVETLVEVLSGVDDAGAFAALNDYHQRREQDYNAIINLTICWSWFFQSV